MIALTVLIKQVSLKVSVEAVAAVALGSPEVVAAEIRHVKCIQYGFEWKQVRSFCIIVYFRISLQFVLALCTTSLSYKVDMYLNEPANLVSSSCQHRSKSSLIH